MQKNGYERRRETIERLRADIDNGLARDKVKFFDPAAAPLGSDDEAAGTPLTEARMKLMRLEEFPQKSGQHGNHYQEAPGERAWVLMAMAAGAAAVAAAAVIALLP